MAQSIAKFIDHTLLSPTATDSELQRICREARKSGFKAVCVAGCRLELARELLTGTDILLATVVGFPHGNASTGAKVCEAASYAGSGADELDVVLNTGWVRSGQWEQVAGELKDLRACASGKTLKLILETCYLDNAEKRKICQMALEAGWDFVKTSTGFGTGGATLEDVRLMKEVVGDAMEIKASGGIRDYETAIKYIEAGATRIGTSSGQAILLGEKNSNL
jgi:deoxyribose-phosphate aldolase